MDSYIINNTGVKFEITRETFAKILNLDSNASNRISEVLSQSTNAKEFSFLREPACTRFILDYFGGEVLHMPGDVCPRKFKDELSFWGITDKEIGTCCLSKYVSFFEDQESMETFEKEEQRENAVKEEIFTRANGKGWTSIQAKVFQFIEYPNTSVNAKVISSLIVVLSLVELVCYTHPMFERPLDKAEQLEYLTAMQRQEHSEKLSNDTIAKMKVLKVSMNFLWYINMLLIAYFTAEMMCKIVFFPLPWKHIVNFQNVTDFIALFVTYLGTLSNEMNVSEKYEHSFYDVIIALQVFRVFRLFRLLKNTSGYKILTFTVKASAGHLILLLMCLLAAVLLFASLAYFSLDKNFTSIPDSAWWAIVTMTTVGYGDVVPSTLPGKLVASACAISGICLIAILIPILVNNFILFHNYSKVINKKGTTTETMLFKSNCITPEMKITNMEENDKVAI